MNEIQIKSTQYYWFKKSRRDMDGTLRWDKEYQLVRILVFVKNDMTHCGLSYRTADVDGEPPDIIPFPAEEYKLFGPIKIPPPPERD